MLNLLAHTSQHYDGDGKSNGSTHAVDNAL